MSPIIDRNVGPLSTYVHHKVVHCRQRYSWDCGVTCVLMLLPEEHQRDLLNNLDTICQEEGFGQSTWTIDLCYLLKRYGISSCLYTTMLGINERHRRQKYYDKILDKDRERVLRRFELASESGIACRQGSVSSEGLLRLTREGPVVVLVDSGLLICDLCKFNKMKVEFRRAFGGQYSGHYILVVGYNARRDKYLYHNPALPHRLCALSGADLMRARTASGTDEDLIVCRQVRTLPAE